MAWIHDSVRESCPDAIVCLDAFHVVRWANDALDKIRREVWNDTRKHHKRGRPPTDIKARATRVTHSRRALVRNPERLTDKQALTLAELEKAGSPLRKAYLLKELLRTLFKELLRTLLKLPADETIERLDTWLDRVDESGLHEFARVAATIRDLRPELEAMLTHRISNGRVESVNAKIRLIQTRASGFHNPYALIALAKLTLSGLCPPLPCRPAT